MKLRRPSRPHDVRPPGGAAIKAAPGGLAAREPAPAEPQRRRRVRGRLVTMVAATIGLGVCTVAACALFVPGLVFGAGRADPPAVPEQANAQKQQDSPAVGDLLVTLPWGSSEGEVGLVRPVEGLARGPEALAVAPDGRIAVLDSVNQRLLFLDDRGQHSATVDVSLAEPRFLAVDDGRVYVLDCDADRQLTTLDWAGVIIGTVALPELPDVVTGLFATSEGPCVEVAHNDVLLVSSPIEAAAEPEADDEEARGAGRSRPASLRSIGGRPVDPDLARMVKVTFAPGQQMRIRMLGIDAGSTRTTQEADFRQPLAPGRSLEHLVSVDGDGSGGLVVGARLLDPGPPDASRAALILTRLAAAKANGAGLSGPVDAGQPQTLLLADSPYAYLGQPYVVTPDGGILQPVGSDAGYSIMVHRFAGDDPAGCGKEVQP